MAIDRLDVPTLTLPVVLLVLHPVAARASTDARPATRASADKAELVPASPISFRGMDVEKTQKKKKRHNETGPIF